MKYSHFLVTFRESNFNAMKQILTEQNLFYRDISGIVKRFFVEVPSGKKQHFFDFLSNHSAVWSVHQYPEPRIDRA
jgi:hypothetical protein